MSPAGTDQHCLIPAHQGSITGVGREGKRPATNAIPTPANDLHARPPRTISSFHLMEASLPITSRTMTIHSSNRTSARPSGTTRIKVSNMSGVVPLVKDP